MGNDVRIISFYLPQYHPIPENDRWWGEGFTDWVNVRRTKLCFPGHYQPHVPADLGYYDLREPEVREAQAAMASTYAIFGFCYYHYWFGGHRLLERPFNEVLASGKPDFPFCLCWANENWTRRWDGMEHEILIQQQHSDSDDIRFIRALFPAFSDKRYIRINGRPLLIVYRTDILPNPARTASIWREEVHRAGLGDLYLCRAETFTTYGNHVDPKMIGFDAALEFPPHAVWSSSLRATTIPADSDFDGDVFDYEQVVLNSLLRPTPSYKLFRGVMPTWDNTPRRRNKGYIFVNSSPELYEEWLADCIAWTMREHVKDERLVFVNAWNEWAEGCHLEPDVRYGYRYLDATRSAIEKSTYLLNVMRSHSVSSNGLDPEMAYNMFLTYVSAIRRTNLELRLKLRIRETEQRRLCGVRQLGPRLLTNDITLRSWLKQCLTADQPPLRRTRKALYSVLRSFFRMAQRLNIVR
jgi:lipopolysaccharide biosynthesis protein